MGDHLNIFLYDKQINYSYRRKLILQHLFSVIISMFFGVIIGYHVFRIEPSQKCYYQKSTNQVYSTSVSDSILVSRRFAIVLIMLMIYHVVDALRSLFALLYICLLQKNHQERTIGNNDIYEHLNTEEVEDMKEGSVSCLEMFYYKLAFNDIIFITAFVLLNVFRLSESGEQCSKEIISQRGQFLIFLLEVYWIICVSLCLLCCIWRCLMSRDDTDSTIVIIPENKYLASQYQDLEK